jgi:hypothetical protein
MKKAGAILLVVVGMGAGTAVQQANAQDKKVEFSLNLGVMTYVGSEGSFAGIGLAFNPQLDIHVTKGFMISPEAMVITDFQFSGAIGFPGVMLNYTGKGFFAGAGVVLAAFESIVPKINIGYRGKKVNLTAYLITSTQQMFSENLVGATIGYRF